MTRRRLEAQWLPAVHAHGTFRWFWFPRLSITNKNHPELAHGLRLAWLRAVVVFWYRARRV